MVVVGELLKKWWVWVILFVVIFLAWQTVSGWAMSRKLYIMALNQLRDDKTTIVNNLRWALEEKEKEITALENQVKVVQKKRAAAETESARLKGLVKAKDAQIVALKKDREAIVIPGDPGLIVAEFHKLGYSSARVWISR